MRNWSGIGWNVVWDWLFIGMGLDWYWTGDHYMLWLGWRFWGCGAGGAGFGCLRGAVVGGKVELVREVPGLLPVCSPLEGRFFSLLLAGRDVEPCGTVGWPREACVLRAAAPLEGLLQWRCKCIRSVDRLPC